MEIEKAFIKTLRPHTLIGSRSYPAGSVVEVPADLARRHVEDKGAIPHAGPAFEPEPDDEEDDPKRKRRTASLDPRKTAENADAK